MRIERRPQKTIPTGVRESRLITNPSDRPLQAKGEVDKLATHHPLGRISTDSRFVVSQVTIDTGYGRTDGTKLTPQATLPITPVEYRGIGGGRIIGGGTSKEAIRKAKKKGRRNAKRLDQTQSI